MGTLPGYWAGKLELCSEAKETPQGAPDASIPKVQVRNSGSSGELVRIPIQWARYFQMRSFEIQTLPPVDELPFHIFKVFLWQ